MGSIKQSRLLADKGLVDQGLYTVAALPAGYVVGEYRGRRLTLAEAKKKRRHKKFLFDVRVPRRKAVAFVVDAADKRRSSFVRYVNAADWEEQQNTAFEQKGGRIFLKTLRRIPKGTELLTWYGKNTAGVINSS